MKIFTKINEYLDNKINTNDNIDEVGRINDISEPYGLYIYSYKKIIHKYPHFIVKLNDKYIGTFLIPTREEWKDNKLKRIHGIENILHEIQIIKLLNEINYMFDDVSNVRRLRTTWNVINYNNTFDWQTKTINPYELSN
jgi:hypothetical protein